MKLNVPERLYRAMTDPVVREGRNSQQLYPSSASMVMPDGKVLGGCMRKEYYRWYQCEEDGEMDPEIQLVCDLGDAWHEVVVRLLKRAQMRSGIEVVSVEHPLWDPKYFLSGRIDLLLYDREQDVLSGVEIKSVGDYVSGMVVDAPKVEHILQAAVYLNHFRENAKATGHKDIDEWIVLYVARSENWKLKRYPHGSVFKYMWQFSVDIEADGHLSVTNQRFETQHHPDITIDAIQARFTDTLDHIRQQQLPARDFVYQYDETTLTAMAKSGLLNKKDTATVDAWIDIGAPTGQLTLDKGDFECRYCDFQKTCYSGSPHNFNTKKSPLHRIKDDKKILVPKAPVSRTDELF